MLWSDCSQIVPGLPSRRAPFGLSCPARLHFAAREGWRRGRDSNPRSTHVESGFQDRLDRPLCHLSPLVDGLWLMVDSRRSVPTRGSRARLPSTINSQPSSTALAGRVGLEPTTNGFGDRYSTN